MSSITSLTGSDAPGEPRATPPVVLTAQGQAWLREQMAARIDDLAAVATRLAQQAEAAPDRADAEVHAGGPDGEGAVARAHYDALIDELSELTAALRDAVGVDEVEEDPRIVELGDEVDVEFPDGSRACWRIVHPLEAPMGEDRIAVTSPLARAVLGHRPGDRVVVATDRGVYGCTIVGRRRLH